MAVKPVEDSAYVRIFQQDGDGQRILEELVSLFYDTPGYELGGKAEDAVYIDGQRSVLRFIMTKAATEEG